MNKDIEYVEVEIALRRLKNGKAAGEDGITGEFIKNLPKCWKLQLTEVLKRMWDEGRLEKGWRAARIFPIYKAGEENNAANYRGISLLDLGYKILTGIMDRRLRTWLEINGKIRESQAGFRSNRGTRDHIFTLNSLIGNNLKEKKKGNCTYVDFKTAFDEVKREILFEKMGKLGIKGRMLAMVKNIWGHQERDNHE